jgi:hypothetical protein
VKAEPEKGLHKVVYLGIDLKKAEWESRAMKQGKRESQR